MIADGVPAHAVYDLLRTEDGVKRAFDKLRGIKGNVIWWTEPHEPPALLAGGKVAYTLAYSDQITNAVIEKKQDFKILWQMQMFAVDYWVIPKTARRPDHAKNFIELASRGSLQANQVKAIFYGPVVKDAFKFLEPEIIHLLPTGRKNLKAAFRIDNAFWTENFPQLQKRFEHGFVSRSAWLELSESATIRRARQPYASMA